MSGSKLWSSDIYWLGLTTNGHLIPYHHYNQWWFIK